MMKKKMIGVITGAALSAMFLFGCGSSSTTPLPSSAAEEIHYADEDFIADMGKALEARWAITNSEETEELLKTLVDGSEEDRELRTSYIEAELAVFNEMDYPNATFEDSKLKEKAISYINCLDDQKEALKYLTVDYDKYYDLWQPAYDKRSQLIKDFAQNYGMTVSEEYKTTLDDMITNAGIVEENEKKEAELNKFVEGVSFELVEESYGLYTYQAVVENTMDYDIVSLDMDVNLIDEDGVNVETTYVYLNNIAKGEKGKMEFMTEEQFEKTKLTVNYSELK